MEKKKHKQGSISDDLSTVKAAAWAWYEHGSGSEGKPVREFDLTQTHPQPRKQSRFKIEAMKIIKESSIQDLSSQKAPSPVHNDHSLLDAYEIERISKHLDYFILSSSNRFNGNLSNSRDLDRQKSTSSTVSSSSDYSNTAAKKKKKEKKNKNFLKRLWLTRTAVCGTREDVVSSALVRSRPPRTVAEEHVPVVRLAVCRPRVAHA